MANRVKDEVYLYLNDMETPVIGPAPFRGVPESWEGAYVRFWHVVDESIAAEAYYTDIKVWGID